MAKNPQPFTNSVPEAVQAPVFNFYIYEKGATYQHNESRIDFVTDGDELYVCVDPVVTTTAPKAKDQGGLLKLVSKGVDGDRGPIGAQGRPGHTPRIAARFANKQMIIYADGEVVGVTGDLTGPAWVPERQGDEIVWNLSRDDERPESIKLDDLRVKEKPLLLRVDSDNTKRSDEESGPANMIQWKYEGDPAWTNLISISELMNLALAGVSIWQTEAGAYHLGHREVIKAKYSATKSGKRIISDVELGEVLFDAGEIVPGLQLDIDDIHLRLEAIEDDIERLKLNMPDLDDYLTRTDAARLYQPKGDYLTEHQSLAGLVKSVSVNNGTAVTPDSNGKVNLTVDIPEVTGVVKSVKVNGTTHNPNGNGLVDLGTITGENADTSDCVKSVKINGTTHTPTNGLVDLGAIGGNGGGSNVTVQSLLNSGTQIATITIDGTPIALYAPNDGTTGGLNRDAVLQLIARVLEGLEDQSITNIYIRAAGDDYFIRKSDLDNYYTKSQVYTKGEIDQMLTGTVPHNRTFMIFKRSASSTTETLPSTAITWNVSTGELDIPNGSNGWTEHPENASAATPYLWVAYGTFESLHGELLGSWDGPFCLTGEKGEEGADGAGIEFIYHLGPKGINGAKPTAPTINYTKSKNYNTDPATTDDNRAKAWWATEASQDWCPGDGSNGYWTDNPTGIDDAVNAQVEWASVRRSHYDTINKVTVWEDFCTPFIWAMWGEDGIDGDGVEYIFCVTATEAEMEVFRNLIPIVGQTYNDFDTRFPNYQTSDWYPKDGQGNANKWTDNPLNVSSNQPYEWVAIRKKNGATGQWGYFSEPKVWGLWGQKTIYQTTSDIIYNNRPYTCYAFTRSVEDLTTRVVKTTWEYNNQTYAQWIAEDPTREADFYDNPLDYIITLKPNGNTWEVDATITWHDTVPESTSPADDLYLITNLIGDEDEEETAWDGPIRWGDSVGFQTEYAAETEETTAVYNKELTLPRLDAYETADPSLDPDNDGINEDAWRTAVNDAHMGVWKDDNTIVNPVYMATCYKKANGHWSAWTVTKVKGERGSDSTVPGPAGRDGTDIEFIYYRTKNETVPTISTNAYKVGEQTVNDDSYEDVDGALPKVLNYNANNSDGGQYWHNHPDGVTEVYKYEWASSRRSYYSNGVKVWDEFYTPATLWSKFGANGRDGDGIEYVFWGLTEQQNAQITYTWPTQKVSSAKNGGHNVDSTRKDSQLRSIDDDEYLPAILINNQKVEAVDDNPGISNNKYVYASMRKYNGTTHTWGEFGEIKLWNEQSDSESNYCVLEIENDSESVLVNASNVIDDAFNTFTVNVDDLWLRKDTNLLTIDKIAVNSVDFVTFSGQNYTPVTGASTTIELDQTHNLTITYGGAYVSSDRYNTKQLLLHLSFTDDSVISTPVQIPISAYSGNFVGTDLLTIFPVKTDKLVKVSTTFTRDYYTSTRGSYDYSESVAHINPSFENFDSLPIKAVEKVNYWIAFDQDKSSAFSQGTTFFGPFSVPSGVNRPGAPGVNGTLEYEYYFKNDGTQTNSQDDQKFIYIKMFHTGNEMRDTDQWSGYAYVYFGDNTANPNNGFLPIDNIIVAVGYPNASGIPVITDREEFKIIYNGAQGPKGESGPYKKELYCLGTENAYNGDWQASWTSTGATIATLTGATHAWSETKPTTTSQYLHVWMTRADVTIGAEATQVCVWEEPTRITPVDGNVTVQYQYLDGTIMRTSEWSSGTTGTTKYWNGDTRVITNNGVESASGNNDGTKYLDVVSVTSGGTTNWYKCKTNHTKSSTDPANDTTNWEVFALMGDAAFRNLLVQNSAYIESLTSRQVVITNGSGSNTTIVGGMTSGALLANIDGLDDNVNATQTSGNTTENVRLWAGAISKTNGVDDLTTAPFKVMDNGHLYATNATISGDITANRIIATEGNSSSSIQIVFGNSSVLNDPDPNTLYFIY